MSLVSIVVLNYRGWQDSITCLETICRQNYDFFNVILVDNDSQNNSHEYISQWARGCLSPHIPVGNPLRDLLFREKSYSLKIHEIDQGQIDSDLIDDSLFSSTEKIGYIDFFLAKASANGGFAAGNNLGIKLALKNKACEYVWLLNSDTMVSPNALTKLVSAYKAEKTGTLGVLGSRLAYYGEPNFLQGIGALYSPSLGIQKTLEHRSINHASFDDMPIRKDIHFPIGASMIITRSYILEVGLLCEDYFLYFEEIDWVLRGKMKGYWPACEVSSLVYHKEGAAIGSSHNRSRVSTFSDSLIFANRLVFTRKFYKLYLVTVYLSSIYLIIKRIFRMQLYRAWIFTRLLLYDIFFQPYCLNRGLVEILVGRK